MPLVPIQTPITPNQLSKNINDNNTYLDSTKANVTDLANYIPLSHQGQPNGVAVLDASSNVVQNALTATTAQNYNATIGTIQSKFASIDSNVAAITNGTTVVGKAITLEPTPAPGNNMLFGTSPSGIVGWYPIPTPGGPGAAPAQEPFTQGDARWSAAVAGIYTLTVAHNGALECTVYMLDGAVYTQVMVDVSRDNINFLVKAMATFAGYLVVE